MILGGKDAPRGKGEHAQRSRRPQRGLASDRGRLLGTAWLLRGRERQRLGERGKASHRGHGGHRGGLALDRGRLSGTAWLLRGKDAPRGKGESIAQRSRRPQRGISVGPRKAFGDSMTSGQERRA